MYVSLLGLMGFIPGYLKSQLMLLWELSPLFFNGLGSLKRSQSTGSWQMFQFLSKKDPGN